MIRRQHGEEYLLISQHEHALLAGKLAEKYGNVRFAAPDPAGDTIAAVAQHDAGWSGHDAAPGLNKANIPVDVFETPLSIALAAWEESADRARGTVSAYAQLLVSVHVLGLSAYAASNSRTRQEQFDLNRFQHREIERQEELRREVGLSTEMPLRLGLAEHASDEAEERLRRNHYILQAMDRISLAVCCSTMPFAKIDQIIPRPGAAAVALQFQRTGGSVLRVEPWPFGVASLELEVSARAVPARTYLDVSDFHGELVAARTQVLMVTVQS